MAREDERQTDLKVKLVHKLASKRVTGGHKKQIDTVKNWVATDEQGDAEDVLRDMVRDPHAPVKRYGGRDAIRLTSMEDAKKFIKDHGGDLPWGLRD